MLWEGTRMGQRESAQVAYVPQILCSLTEIKKTFRVSESTVKKWIQKGAPIAVENDGARIRYSAESLRLQIWRELQIVQNQE